MWLLSAAGVRGHDLDCALRALMAAWVPRLRAPAWQVVLAVLLAQAIVDWTVKPIIARPRPFVADTRARVVGYHPETYSFPSGHTATSFAAATVLAFAIAPPACGGHVGAGRGDRGFTDLHRRPLPARCGRRRGLRRAARRLGYGRTCMVYWGFVSGVPPRAEVAQLVEHTTENRGVGSSILPLGTITSRQTREFRCSGEPRDLARRDNRIRLSSTSSVASSTPCCASASDERPSRRSRGGTSASRAQEPGGVLREGVQRAYTTESCSAESSRAPVLLSSS